MTSETVSRHSRTPEFGALPRVLQGERNVNGREEEPKEFAKRARSVPRHREALARIHVRTRFQGAQVLPAFPFVRRWSLECQKILPGGFGFEVILYDGFREGLGSRDSGVVGTCLCSR